MPGLTTTCFGSNFAHITTFDKVWITFNISPVRPNFVRLLKDNHRKRIRTMAIDMSNNDTDMENYWFRTQRYGWGWGLPLTWQD